MDTIDANKWFKKFEFELGLGLYENVNEGFKDFYAFKFTDISNIHKLDNGINLVLFDKSHACKELIKILKEFFDKNGYTPDLTLINSKLNDDSSFGFCINTFYKKYFFYDDLKYWFDYDYNENYFYYSRKELEISND